MSQQGTSEKVLVLMGPQGSGKSFHTRWLREIFYQITGMGDILRKMRKEDKNFPAEVARLMDERALVPDEFVTSIFQQFASSMESTEKRVFEGFPRTLNQAWEFIQTMQRLGREIVVVYLELSDDQAVESIMNADDRGDRTDDKPHLIKKGLAEFRQKTQPIVALFEEKGIPVISLPRTSRNEVAHGIQRALGIPEFTVDVTDIEEEVRAERN